MQLRSRAANRKDSFATSPRSPTKSYPALAGDGVSRDGHSPDSPDGKGDPFDVEGVYEYTPPVVFVPNRRLESGATIHGGVSVAAAKNLAARESSMTNPFVAGYISPIGESQLV